GSGAAGQRNSRSSGIRVKRRTTMEFMRLRSYTATPVYANVPNSRTRRRAGTIMSGLAILILLFDVLTKVMEASLPVIGVILLLCVIAYAVPATSVTGAILLTGYLGGAVATQLRVGNPLFTHTLFPIYLGALIWGGLLLREERLRALVPLRR
ncbi:MAG TPA: DoxX family protein, partial [Gemmatimonadales bacterium]|nr:DoxX family protein [Gemmatimonadales bacterium]